MVCFRAAGTDYCLPVESTRAVRTATDLRTIPGTAADIAGILPGQPPLTVISVLGGVEGNHGFVLVVESGDTTFGLLVDAVDGLRRIAATDIRPVATGRGRDYISGTVDTDGRFRLVADPKALAARL